MLHHCRPDVSDTHPILLDGTGQISLFAGSQTLRETLLSHHTDHHQSALALCADTEYLVDRVTCYRPAPDVVGFVHNGTCVEDIVPPELSRGVADGAADDADGAGAGGAGRVVESESGGTSAVSSRGASRRANRPSTAMAGIAGALAAAVVSNVAAPSSPSASSSSASAPSASTADIPSERAFCAHELPTELSEYLAARQEADRCLYEPLVPAGDKNEAGGAQARAHVMSAHEVAQQPDMHAFVRLNIPSKCKACKKACYFNSVICTKCNLTCHKRCTEKLQVCSACAMPTESVCGERERERESVCVCVCVCVTERGGQKQTHIHTHTHNTTLPPSLCAACWQAPCPGAPALHGSSSQRSNSRHKKFNKAVFGTPLESQVRVHGAVLHRDVANTSKQRLHATHVNIHSLRLKFLPLLHAHTHTHMFSLSHTHRTRTWWTRCL